NPERRRLSRFMGQYFDTLGGVLIVESLRFPSSPLRVELASALLGKAIMTLGAGCDIAAYKAPGVGELNRQRCGFSGNVASDRAAPSLGPWTGLGFQHLWNGVYYLDLRLVTLSERIAASFRAVNTDVDVRL